MNIFIMNIFCRMPFCSIDGVLPCTEAFQLDIVLYVHFCCCFPCWGRYVHEEVTHVYVQEIFAYVCSKSFMVLWLTFRSLIHFEYTFVYRVRQ